MECVPRHNTIDCPTLYWAAIPGNAADFPAEESFPHLHRTGGVPVHRETNYRSSLSPFGIKMVDRLTGKPLHLDISDLPMKRGITTNRNKFVLGPSGSGKSFFMNHLVRQYYEQGAHVVLVDTGNSYQGLCGAYYRGGRYDFLLNSTENIDLLGKRFIVFEIDSIKENREFSPVVTIIMEAFINKMRRLKGAETAYRGRGLEGPLIGEHG